MQKAIYDNFLRQYAANRPNEAIATEKALAHFNKQSVERPYEVTEEQGKKNYKTMQYDVKLDNGEKSIKIEVKTDHVRCLASRRIASFCSSSSLAPPLPHRVFRRSVC